MKKYIIFGCGNYFKQRLDLFESIMDIECVCDNNSSLWGTVWNERYECISPQQLLKYSEYDIIISVQAESDVRDISIQLDAMGVKYLHINELIAESVINAKVKLEYEDSEKFEEMVESQSEHVIVLGAPAHSNLGDQAQSYCIQTIIEEQFPQKKVFVFEGNILRKNYYFLLYLIRSSIRENDIILIHSGYHCTDLFLKEELLNEKIIELFQNKKLLFLPQTVFFKNEQLMKKSAEIYNTHPNVTIMCRDEISFAYAKTLYTNCKLMLYPDIVTSLIGRRKYNNKRKGILVCLRKLGSVESQFSEDKKEKLISDLSLIDTVSVTDTDSPVHWKIIREKRSEIIEKELEYYAQFKVIITDRYHGMIFSLISNTPVVVVGSTDHKLSSGIKWFPTNIYKSISFTENIDNICNIVKLIVNNDLSDIVNPTYLYDKYYKRFSIINKLGDWADEYKTT